MNNGSYCLKGFSTLNSKEIIKFSCVSKLILMLLQYQESHSYCERRRDKPEKMQKRNGGGNAALKFLQQLAMTSWASV